MQRVSRAVGSVVLSIWFAAAGGLSSIAAFAWFLYDKYAQSQGFLSNFVFYSCLVIFAASFLWTFLIRAENKSLRDLSRIFFEMDEIYRDRLREFFCPDTPFLDAHELIRKEEEVLSAICQRVENIFSVAIGRQCMATIKVVVHENDRCYAKTYVRSQKFSNRDKDGFKKYAVGVAENTAFDIASARRADGRPSHFYSPDLSAEKAPFSNQRPNFLSYYQSAIVVPIWGVNSGKEGTRNEHDLVGFLCVDTLSRNRLNDGFHVYMLSAIACEIYNFMNLMRKKYKIVDEVRDVAA